MVAFSDNEEDTCNFYVNMQGLLKTDPGIYNVANVWYGS